MLMKAAITDGKGKLWLEEVPTPEPDEFQCLCKMRACASCTGTDQKHIYNKLPWQQDYPGILGHESIGEVVEVGAKVKHFAKGDLVFRPTPVYPGDTLAGFTSMWGGFAEYGLVTDVPAMLSANPEVTPNNYTRFQQTWPADLGVSPAEATTVITLKETASYVASLGVGLYSKIAILGAGSVGISMCRFAKIFGAYPVIMVARRDEQLVYAKERIGADFLVNAAKEDAVEGIRDRTDGQGVDRIVDTTGNTAFFASCIPALSGQGKAAAYATYPSDDPAANHIDAAKLIVGTTGEDAAHQYLIDCARLGLVNLQDFYSHCMPFARIAEGFEMLKHKEAFKIVFEMEE